MNRALTIAFAIWAFVPAVPATARPSPAMRAYLEERIASNPADASSRRLLGRMLLDAGDLPGAVAHFRIAVEEAPLSGAARFDLGRALYAGGDLAGAAAEWRQVIDLAPGTEYAADAEARLSDLPPGVVDEIEAASYEIRDFPGPPAPGPTVDPLDGPVERLPILARFETGLLYNSNVALAPSSRQLAPGDRQSFQLFAAPELEWAAVAGDGWAVGPLFTGYFTLNEGNFREFNLQSYTPGLFAEASVDRAGGTLVPRLEYRFTLDEFDGSSFARRHGVTGRLTARHAVGGATTGYVAIDHTDFADDGILPEVTSADGVDYATGVSHEIASDFRWLKTVRAGVDLDRLDARGSDYAYWGIGLSSQAVIPIVESVELTLRGGWGYRDYDRYEFVPGRDEFIWRAGGELRKWFTPQFSVAAVANYQLFDSNNPLFEADRFVAGAVTEYLY